MFGARMVRAIFRQEPRQRTQSSQDARTVRITDLATVFII